MQQQNPQKVEASKVPEYIKKAAKKAAEFNSNFNRERMEERRAYFDLQTHVSAVSPNVCVPEVSQGLIVLHLAGTQPVCEDSKGHCPGLFNGLLCYVDGVFCGLSQIIQVPQGRFKVLAPELTSTGPYPVALIPGQFQEYYKR